MAPKADKKPAVDQVAMRAHNRNLALRLLWQLRRASRADLARSTGMSRSTISGIVDELEQLGLVATLGGRAGASGRRGLQVALVDEAFGALGLELGVRHVSAGAVDLGGRVLAFREIEHDVRSDPEATLALAGDLLDACVAESRLTRRRVLGLGVAVANPVSRERPGELTPALAPAWQGVDLVARLGRARGTTVLVDNDANLGALAEHVWGASCPDLAFVKVGAGVGCGLVFAGQVFRGASGAAGELGHTVIDPSGPACACGNRGCVTTYVGAPALLARAAQRGRAGEQAADSLAGLIARARAGARSAVSILDEAGQHLGVAIGSLVNLLDPGMVVVGGELAAAGDLVLGPLRREVKRRVLPSVYASTPIVTSSLGRQAVVIGAATLVLRSALEDGGLVAAATPVS